MGVQVNSGGERDTVFLLGNKVKSTKAGDVQFIVFKVRSEYILFRNAVLQDKMPSLSATIRNEEIS